MLCGGGGGEDQLLQQSEDAAAAAYVRTLSGKLIADLRLPSTTTILGIKQVIASKCSIPVREQRLVLGVRRLTNEERLEVLGNPLECQLIRMHFDDNESMRLLNSIWDSEVTEFGQALDNHADPDFICLQTTPPVTPLCVASHVGRLQMVRRLHQAAADVNNVLIQSSPLEYASRAGHLEVLTFLCEAGAEVNHASHDGRTPLYYAADLGHVDVVRYLCKVRADVDKATSFGNTPLMAAAQFGRLEIVKCLHEAGAVLEMTASDGATALDAAADGKHKDVAEYLGGNCGTIDNGAKRR